MGKQRYKYFIFGIALVISFLLFGKKTSALASQPDPFSITSPSDGYTVSYGDDLRIRWSTSSGASYYTVSVKDLSNDRYVAELERVTGTSYTVYGDELTPGHNYRIGLVSYSSYGESRNGGTVSFSVRESSQPGSFYISSPEDGTHYGDGDNFSVRWTSSSGASYYTISIKDLNTGRYVTELETVYGTSYKVYGSDLTAGHTYRVGLVSYNSAGVTRNGGTITFYVDEKLERAPWYDGSNYYYTAEIDGTLTLSGYVKGESYFTAISVDVFDPTGYTRRFSASLGTTKSYNLANLKMDLSQYPFEPGTYTFSLWAKTQGYTAPSAPVASFTVEIRENEYAGYVSQDLETLSIGYKSGDNETNVTGNITLPSRGINGSTIRWTSSDSSIISADGVVTPSGSYDQFVVLTATATNNGKSATKDFFLFVPMKKETQPWIENGTYSYTAAADGKLTLSGTIKSETEMTTVTCGFVDRTYGIERSISKNPNSKRYSLSNFVFDLSQYNLPAGYYEINVWVKTQGITNPSAPIATLLVNLTASSRDKLNADADLIYITYKSGEWSGGVKSDITLPSKGENGSTISWTSSNSSVISSKGKVTPPKGKDASVTLTAKLTLNGQSITRDFQLVVLKKAVKIPVCTGLPSSYSVYDNGEVTLSGRVSADTNLTVVTVNVKNPQGIKKDFRNKPNQKTFDLSNVTIAVSSLGLEPGTYTLNVWAKTAEYDNPQEPVATASFTILPSEETKLSADKKALKLGFNGSDNKKSVTGNITLAGSGPKYGTVITWKSSNEKIITSNGKVTRPAKDTEVTLTATLKSGSKSDEKTFTITVKAEGKKPVTNYKDASAIKLYKNMFKDLKAAGYLSKKIKTLSIEGKKYEVYMYNALVVKGDNTREKIPIFVYEGTEKIVANEAEIKKLNKLYYAVCVNEDINEKALNNVVDSLGNIISLCLQAETCYKACEGVGIAVGVYATGGYTSGIAKGLKKVGTELVKAQLPSKPKDAVELLGKTSVIAVIGYYRDMFRHYAKEFKAGTLTSYEEYERFVCMAQECEKMIDPSVAYMIDVFSIPKNKFDAAVKGISAYLGGIIGLLTDTVEAGLYYVSPSKDQLKHAELVKKLRVVNGKIEELSLNNLAGNAALSSYMGDLNIKIKDLFSISNLKKGGKAIYQFSGWIENYYSAVRNAVGVTFGNRDYDDVISGYSWAYNSMINDSKK